MLLDYMYSYMHKIAISSQSVHVSIDNFVSKFLKYLLMYIIDLFIMTVRYILCYLNYG